MFAISNKSEQAVRAMISVIICTYNRAALLKRALGSILSANVPEGWSREVIIIDNASTDNTPNIVAETVSDFPSIVRYVLEPKQGLSFARNRGVNEAKGDVLVFTDDDVLVTQQWLVELCTPIACGHAVAACGKILPCEKIQIPTWLPQMSNVYFPPLALFDRGDDPIALDESPFGANMAFRGDVFRRYGLFRSDLGRRPDSLMSGEDTDFGNRLLRGGERIWYEPSAIVFHPVQYERLTREYLLRWWHDKARSDVRMNADASRTPFNICGLSPRRCASLLIWTVKWLIEPRSKARFLAKVTLWSKLGAARENVRLWRGSEIGSTSNERKSAREAARAERSKK